MWQNRLMFAIEIENLCREFGHRRVVDDVSLTAQAGEVLGVLGPNGSGKTTLLRMICGLLTPTAGSGRVLGMDLMRSRKRIKAATGYMTQKFSMYEDLTLAENLLFQARIQGLKEPQKHVASALDRLGAVVLPTQLAGHLSGGWKQRLALEAAMVHGPKLLLLDEPTAGVDPSARRDFWDRIQDVAAQGVTVLVSTHYMDEAERCDRLAIMHMGRLLRSGTAAELETSSGLLTWEIEGPSIETLAIALAGFSGVEQTSRYGQRLHVIGKDGTALSAAIAACVGPAHSARMIRTGIEDIFINATGQSLKQQQGPKQ